ncbi:hypothetical protein GN244_ATG16524 [Phytophthora infestans]|uniref:Uncharacterized protein n=1 Tax=Phytophthora infestans TaxID=4787 RepID=A0A833W7C4_PHYIN|nr:hypothetical protein GN244_ATG16524 [Phytophthora infestans]KAF4129782.1 hypothetical protein GN958_ATG21028 [Phytophthora infestans]
MLQEAKQICYDEGQHAIHIICWTRELAAKWSTVFTSLQFRNCHFPLQNVHTEELGAETNPEQRAKQVWARQIGADGILNEQPRDRYHIRLLNISRFMDEAAIDMFLQAHFSGTYTTWQEPCTDNYCVTVSAWDIETLPKQASTVTSFKELDSCWVPPDTKRETTPSTRQHEEEGRVGRNDGGSTWQEANRAEITPNQEASNTPQAMVRMGAPEL